MIAEALRCNAAEIKSISSIWLNQFTLLVRGQKYVADVSKKVFGVDPTYFQILLQSKKALSKSKWKREEFLKLMQTFIVSHLKKQSKAIRGDTSDVLSSAAAPILDLFQITFKDDLEIDISKAPEMFCPFSSKKEEVSNGEYIQL